MVNRELIRLKVVQLSYAYYQNGNGNLDIALKELGFSLSKAYDLYLYMLSLMVAVHRVAERRVETAANRYRRLGEGEPPSTKFIDNQFMAQLQANQQLLEFTSQVGGKSLLNKMHEVRHTTHSVCRTFLVQEPEEPEGNFVA